jgi:RNA polymerase-associated protein CTR9
MGSNALQNPDSKVASILLGIYHLHSSSQFDPSDEKFRLEFAKAMTQFAQKAFKLDNNYPLTCATFGGYFLLRKTWTHVQKLAEKAIARSDINAIASDGWYLLARMAHYQGEIDRAYEYYLRADQARGGDGRGGDDRGYLPAKFGLAQIKILQSDTTDAKFRLDKLQKIKSNPETMTLLGIMYAEEYFSAQLLPSKDDDKSEAWKKAVSFLDGVRQSWKDPKKKATPDPAVLLNLARLYETDSPAKSLQCLQEVERLELANMPEEKRPEGIKEEELREQLPPQLLNNVGCFHHQADRFSQARENFQTALSACVRIGSEDTSVDTDALVTTISFNLARTYESEGMLDEAKEVYEGLLDRHGEYLDASARLAYIALLQDPSGEGPKAVSRVYHNAPENLEIRAMYGWYLNKAKKKTQAVAEDQEQRHLKHTLRDFNKHDLYSLTAMGNLHLTIAREMPRISDQDKEKRRRMYEKAVEFFAKALELDPKNAYAAQGIGVAIVEDKKDLRGGIQIFSKVRETMKDPSVSINLGHAYVELKQYSRAIENYEAALAKNRAKDVTVLTCLGRVWMLRGKAEKSLPAMVKALEYSQDALSVSPSQVHFKFNIAYVQFQIAQLVTTSLEKDQKSVEEVENAIEGLDAAIESFSEIAKSPNPPFPRNDLEQRANMGRNTLRRQIERVLRDQKEYEQTNATKLAAAREAREAAIQEQEQKKRKAAEEAEKERQKILEERLKMQERDRELAEKRIEQQRRLEEENMTTDSETGAKKKRVKRKGGKRKKKDADSDTDGDGSVDGARSRGRSVVTGDEAEAGEPKRKKKRKLERKSTATAKAQSKFKSAEFVGDSDDDDDAAPAPTSENGVATPDSTMVDAEDDAPASRPRKKVTRVIDDDDEDEGEGDISMHDSAPTPAVGGDDDEE